MNLKIKLLTICSMKSPVGASFLREYTTFPSIFAQYFIPSNSDVKCVTCNEDYELEVWVFILTKKLNLVPW